MSSAPTEMLDTTDFASVWGSAEEEETKPLVVPKTPPECMSASPAPRSSASSVASECGWCGGPLLLIRAGEPSKSDGTDGKACMWCVRLHGIVGKDSGAFPEKVVAGGRLWNDLQQALQVLVLAGEPNITAERLKSGMESLLTSQTPSTRARSLGTTSTSSFGACSASGMLASTPRAKKTSGSSGAEGVSPLQDLSAKLAAKLASPKALGLKRGKSGPLREDTDNAVDTAGERGESHQDPELCPGRQADGWEEHVALTPEGLGGPLPAGQMFTSIKRIRGTINDYADRCATVNAVIGLNMHTLHALHRRCEKYGGEIIGKAPTVHIELGFKQMLRRSAAIIELLKGIRGWQDAQVDTALINVLGPIRVLGKYLEAVGKEMAADIMLFKVYGEFHVGFRKHASLSKAMDVVDPAILKKTVAALNSVKVTPSAAAQQSLEAIGDEGELRGDSGEGPEGKKKRRVHKPKPVELASFFATRVEGHMQRLVGDALKVMLVELPADLQDLMPDIIEISQDIAAAAAKYREEYVTKGDDDFVKVLLSVRLMFLCCAEHEKDKLATSEVREALRTIYSLAKCSDISYKPGELAKAALTYPAGRLIVSEGKRFSATGIEDDAADKSFLRLSEAFEQEFDIVFDGGVSEWVTDPTTGIVSVRSLLAKLQPMQPMVTMLIGIARRWSKATLEKRMQGLEELISNMVQISGIALKAMVRAVVLAMGSVPLGQSSVAVADGLAAAGDDNAAARIEDSQVDDVRIVPTSRRIPATTVFGTSGSFSDLRGQLVTMANVASGIREDMGSWKKVCHCILQPLTILVRYIFEQVGDDRGEKFKGEADPRPFEKEAEDNTDSIARMCDYVCLSMEVVTGVGMDNIGEHFGAIAESAEKTKFLVEFTKVHCGQDNRGPTTVSCCSPAFEDDTSADVLNSSFLRFTKEVGDMIFKRVSVEFVKASS